MFSQPVPFPLRRLEPGAGGRGSGRVVGPLYLETEETAWRNIADRSNPPHPVIGYNPVDDLLTVPEVRDQRELWDRPDSALSDRRSKSGIFGPVGTGTRSELQGRPIRIVGQFTLGTDFRNNGTLVMTERTCSATSLRRLARDRATP